MNLNNNNNNIFNYEDNFINNTINKIYASNDLNDIIRYTQNTNNLYFDILDNVHFITNDLETIVDIYKTSMAAENVNTYYIKNHLDLYDLFTLLSIIYPKYLLNSEINERKIINNKYISKSLIYISNERYIYNNNLNKDIIYLLNKLKDDKEFTKFMKENYICENDKLKKILNIYEKIIKFE